jgi:hypothetical protein
VRTPRKWYYGEVNCLPEIIVPTKLADDLEKLAKERGSTVEQLRNEMLLATKKETG